jgi:murein DD-endopeptidase MepM/ murein hydrolase activator NlpD
MTRFGKWFAGVLVGLIALLALLMLTPHSPDVRVADAPVRPVRPEAVNRDGVPGGLIVPVVGVRSADLTDTFGDPRGPEGERGHGALDIMAPHGTQVVAAASGTIEKIFESELGGHTIYVRSPDRAFVYYYAHLESYAPGAREGVYVAQGEPLGTVGSSGDADPAGPHLHFEVKRMQPGEAWHEGVGIDPYPLLAGTPAGR